jgi:hypothetical protein
VVLINRVGIAAPTVNFPNADDNRSHGSANVVFATLADLKKALDYNEEVCLPLISFAVLKPEDAGRATSAHGSAAQQASLGAQPRLWSQPDGLLE